MLDMFDLIAFLYDVVIIQRYEFQLSDDVRKQSGTFVKIICGFDKLIVDAFWLIHQYILGTVVDDV